MPPAQPSAPPGEVPGHRESSARALGRQPWHRRGCFYFPLMTFLFSLGGLKSGISRNHGGMRFLRRKRSPRVLPWGWRHAEGHPRARPAQFKPAALQLGAGYSPLAPCSQLRGQTPSEGKATGTSRMYSQRLAQRPLPPTSHSFLFFYFLEAVNISPFPLCSPGFSPIRLSTSSRSLETREEKETFG